MRLVCRKCGRTARGFLPQRVLRASPCSGTSASRLLAADASGRAAARSRYADAFSENEMVSKGATRAGVTRETADISEDKKRMRDDIDVQGPAERMAIRRRVDVDAEGRARGGQDVHLPRHAELEVGADKTDAPQTQAEMEDVQCSSSAAGIATCRARHGRGSPEPQARATRRRITGKQAVDLHRHGSACRPIPPAVQSHPPADDDVPHLVESPPATAGWDESRRVQSDDPLDCEEVDRDLDEEAFEEHAHAPLEGVHGTAAPPMESTGVENGDSRSSALADGGVRFRSSPRRGGGADAAPLDEGMDHGEARPKKRAREPIGRGHRLSFTGGVVWCRTCGHYTEKRTHGLANDCTGEATGVYVSRRRRLQESRHPLTAKPLA